MKSLWNDAEAAQFTGPLGPRVYSSRLLGRDPTLVLQRGYAWLADEEGRTITQVGQTFAGQALQATLADGKVDLTVSPREKN